MISDRIALPCRWGGLGFATRTRVQPIAFYSAWRLTFRSNQGDWPYLTELEREVSADRTSQTSAPTELPWSTAQLADQIYELALAIQRSLRPETPPRILRLTTLQPPQATPQGDIADEAEAWNNGSVQQSSHERHTIVHSRLSQQSAIVS